MNTRNALTLTAICAIASSVALGCGGDEQKYKPKPAFSGAAAQLPAVPTLPKKNKKVDGAYTVWGASHDLRSRVHNKDVAGKEITLIGYIVKVNYTDAPECAIHETGEGDPADCKAPVPSFSIADEKGEEKAVIEVMGWASNFAQIYSLIEEVDKAAKGEEGEIEAMDEFWGQKMMIPIPNLGAKVKITGNYDVTFTKATGGAAANPKYGIMTAATIEYLEMPETLANLPTMKDRKKSVADLKGE